MVAVVVVVELVRPATVEPVASGPWALADKESLSTETYMTAATVVDTMEGMVVVGRLGADREVLVVLHWQAITVQEPRVRPFHRS